MYKQNGKNIQESNLLNQLYPIKKKLLRILFHSMHMSFFHATLLGTWFSKTFLFHCFHIRQPATMKISSGWLKVFFPWTMMLYVLLLSLTVTIFALPLSNMAPCFSVFFPSRRLIDDITIWSCLLTTNLTTRGVSCCFSPRVFHREQMRSQLRCRITTNKMLVEDCIKATITVNSK